MSLSIQTNTEAYDPFLNVLNTQDQISASIEKLGSGAGETAGSTIGETLTAQVGGVGQAQRNAQDAELIVQTGEGAMAEVQSILERVRDLAVEFNSGALSASGEAAITADVAQLCAAVEQIAAETSFGGVPLLAGGQTLSFQIGVDDAQTLSVSGVPLLGADAAIDPSIFTFGGGANVSGIDAAIRNVSDARATFGEVQNRLEHTLNSLATYEENRSASESRIKDVDMASEMTTFTKLQIMEQAGMATLAQANQSPSTVLSLLQHP